MSSILDKIRQLRELSKSSNINEATAAAAAADKLIAKHRISEVELNLANKVADLPAQEDPGVLYESGRVTAWKRNLGQKLSNHYGCMLWNDWIKSNGRKLSRYRLVGVQSDIEIVRYMFAWLTNEIERLSKLHCAGMGHVYSQSYCEGAVAGISQQLDKMKQEQDIAANQSGQTTALACLDERLSKAEKTLYSLHDNLRKVKTYSHSQHDGGAYNLGVNVGKSIHLGKVMGTSGSNKMLK